MSNTQYMRQWRLKNPERVKAIRDKHYQENKDKINARKKLNQKWVSTKYNYGLTQKDYKLLLQSQNNKCKLCGKEFGSQIPCVDHCHKTGKVRGIIHKKCNAFIGMADDSVELLKRGITYLNLTK